MRAATFTSHTLPILANWSQFLGGAPLIGGLALAYMHHRCHTCWRWGRFKVGEHRVPTCHRHRRKSEWAS